MVEHYRAVCKQCRTLSQRSEPSTNFTIQHCKIGRDIQNEMVPSNCIIPAVPFAGNVKVFYLEGGQVTQKQTAQYLGVNVLDRGLNIDKTISRMDESTENTTTNPINWEERWSSKWHCDAMTCNGTGYRTHLMKRDGQLSTVCCTSEANVLRFVLGCFTGTYWKRLRAFIRRYSYEQLQAVRLKGMLSLIRTC